MSLIQTLRFIARHPLNRNDKLGSVLRFARWQLGSRLVPGDVICPWINGSRFLARPGETGITGNIYTGLHEFADMGFLLHFLRPGDLFVDVGANVGSYTILACAAAGARGIAFEPVPATHQRLRDNVRLNELEERVRCLNMGVGARPGTLAFTRDRDATNHALAPGERAANAIDVEVTSLDVALAGEAPVLMKIDVEGYETPVIEGARETLSRPSLATVIMELNGSGLRYGFDEAAILAQMAALGFGTYSYDPLERRLVELDGKNLESGNTLFVRDKSRTLERLADAPEVLIHGMHL
jgi:FkbM family methyltransferase